MRPASQHPVADGPAPKAKDETRSAKRDPPLHSLQAVSTAIASGEDLKHTLTTIARATGQLLDMKACYLTRWSRENTTSTLLVGYDPDQWLGSRMHDFSSPTPPARERALLEPRPYLVVKGQANLAPADEAYMGGCGIGSWLVLPMLFQDRVLGLLEVMDESSERAPTTEEIALAELLANQAATVLENTRLYDMVHRHVAEMATLNRIGQMITSILDLDRALSIIADQAIWLLDVEAASVILYEQTGGSMWFGAAAGHNAHSVRNRRLSRDHGIAGWVIQHGKPLLVPDAPADARSCDDWTRESGFSIRSILCVPLQAKGQIIGAIEALNKQTGVFDEEDLTLLTSLAASAAIAIENARLYEQACLEIAERTRVEDRLRKINRALRTRSECHEALMRARDEGELLKEVCRLLVEAGGHRLAWIGFVGEDPENKILPMARAGHDEGFVDSLPLSWAEGVLTCDPMGTAIRTGQPHLAADLLADPACVPWREAAIQRGYASAMALPLIAGSQTLGGLALYAGAANAFDPEETNLLKELANDLALGLLTLRARAERDQAEEKSQHLYQELQDHAASLEDTVADRTRELQSERDRTQAILEAVGEAVIVTDLQGTIRYLNPAAVELTGHTVDSAAGRSPHHWQDNVEPSSSRLPGADTGTLETRRAEVVSRRRDGSLYDAAMTVAPLFDSQQADRLIGYVSVQRDITPIKDAERMKDQFVSNVSHELRTPLSILTLLSGNLDRLYERLPDERRKSMIQGIRDQAQVLNSLIDDVLEISRIESGRVSVERQEADLAQLAREEVEKQLLLAQKKSQALNMTGLGPLWVWANPDQIRQVIRNLVNNAIKYTPEQGQITCECRVLPADVSEEQWPGSAELPKGDWAALRLVDTGIGIDQSDMPHLYERFYRVKTQSNIPGTGLGLSISQELVDLHGGRMAVASALGKGSIFAVYLPLLEKAHGD